MPRVLTACLLACLLALLPAASSLSTHTTVSVGAQNDLSNYKPRVIEQKQPIQYVAAAICWPPNLPAYVFCLCFVFSLARGTILVSTLDGRVTGLDFQSGSPLWSFSSDSPLLSSLRSSKPRQATSADEDYTDLDGHHAHTPFEDLEDPDEPDTGSDEGKALREVMPLVIAGVDGSLYKAGERGLEVHPRPIAASCSARKLVCAVGAVQRSPVSIPEMINKAPFRTAGKLFLAPLVMSSQVLCVAQMAPDTLGPRSRTPTC